MLDIGFLWEKKKKTASVFISFMCIVIFLLIYFPSYWNFTTPVLSKSIPSGITENGYPWIGAESPELTITEFADYQCFQCKKMHFFLRQLVANYPNKIRLIHRHFPLDHEYNPIIKKPFHVGSGAMSIFAQYAQTQNKFWKMNDTLFDIAGKKGRIDIKELAGFVGLDHIALAASIQNKIMRYKVKHDISVGIKLGINGTPAYIIKDQVYLGQIPAKIIKDILD